MDNTRFVIRQFRYSHFFLICFGKKRGVIDEKGKLYENKVNSDLVEGYFQIMNLKSFIRFCGVDT